MSIWVWVGLVGWMGCAARAEERPAPPALSAEMQRHSADARAIREALVVGDLATAQAAGRALAERLPLPELPAKPQGPVREAALALSTALSVEQAALAFGQLSAACGGCHTAVQASPRLPAPPPPPAEESFEAQMQRYHWAAERMWQGLVLPSEDALAEARAQLRALPTAPFLPEEASSLPLGSASLDAALHEQARKVRPGERGGRAYGSMLLMCAACHEANPQSPAHDEPRDE